MNIKKEIVLRCVDVVEEYLDITFNLSQMDSFLVDNGLATEMADFPPDSDTMSREQLCSAISQHVLGRPIPCYGDRLSDDQINQFYLDLRLAAKQKGYKVIT